MSKDGLLYIEKYKTVVCGILLRNLIVEVHG